jgi:hypothetical protein
METSIEKFDFEINKYPLPNSYCIINNPPVDVISLFIPNYIVLDKSTDKIVIPINWEISKTYTLLINKVTTSNIIETYYTESQILYKTYSINELYIEGCIYKESIPKELLIKSTSRIIKIENMLKLFKTICKTINKNKEKLKIEKDKHFIIPNSSKQLEIILNGDNNKKRSLYLSIHNNFNSINDFIIYIYDKIINFVKNTICYLKRIKTNMEQFCIDDSIDEYLLFLNKSKYIKNKGRNETVINLYTFFNDEMYYYFKHSKTYVKTKSISIVKQKNNNNWLIWFGCPDSKEIIDKEQIIKTFQYHSFIKSKSKKIKNLQTPSQ